MTFEGLVIDTDSPDLVRPGSQLIAIFYIDIDGVKRRCQEIVRVTQVEGHTAGLKFECFDNGHSCNIEKLIHLAKIATSH